MRRKPTFKNYSMFVEEKQGSSWYDWCVFASGDTDTVNSIRQVKYFLHPTFPDPERLVTDKDSRFALFSSGWGSFTIGISVIFETGEMLETKHFLGLHEADWPRLRLSEEVEDPNVRVVHEQLFHERYRWLEFETIVKKTNLSSEAVREILESLQAQNLVRKAHFKSIYHKELWGATAVVGISPRLGSPE